MEEKNELNDIILNKGGESNGNKKIILAVATLGVILIIVVMLMNTLTSDGTDNLPQAVLPPEPNIKSAQQNADESLFEEVEVIQEDKQDGDSLDKIAQRLKQESKEEKTVAPPAVKPEKKETPKKVVETKKETPEVKSKPSQTYYIQVGSFSKYEPNKKFLKSITDKGFSYKYHKVTKDSKTLNKVLVGPFNSEKEARSALRTIRTSVEAGAFLTKI